MGVEQQAMWFDRLESQRESIRGSSYRGIRSKQIEFDVFLTPNVYFRTVAKRYTVQEQTNDKRILPYHSSIIF
jgi:hypothetical protein